MHKLGSRRALSFASVSKETLNFAVESSGAAYRIRTYDPRITKARIAARQSLDYINNSAETVGEFRFNPRPTHTRINSNSRGFLSKTLWSNEIAKSDLRSTCRLSIASHRMFHVSAEVYATSFTTVASS